MRAFVIAIVVATSPAFADDTARSQAVTLFDEGIKEMKAGHFEVACAAFAKSNELRADSGTRGSLARCYEKLGKLASAWRLWTNLATTAPKQLRGDAAANAAALEPRLPKYIIMLAPGAPRVSITIDGTSVSSTPGVAVPIDPGQHTFEAKAPGYAGWKAEDIALEGITMDISIPALEPAKSSPEPRPDAVLVEKPAPVQTIYADKAAPSARRPVGFALLGVGGALVVTGAVFGVIARGRYHDAQAICGGDIASCDNARIEEAQTNVDSARAAGNVATVTMIAGGAAVATGIVMLVTAPKSQPRRVSILPAIGGDSAGVVVRAGF